jgi:AraC family transcriptional activator of pobA
MSKIETIQDFYKAKFDWLPDNFRKELGHFNVFKLEPFVPGKPTSLPYQRRDYYKIMLVMGGSKVYYADKIIEIEKQALAFSNPQIPYSWEHLDKIRSGVYCVFNQEFFQQFGNLSQYEVFQPGGNHIFELTDEQVERVNAIFRRIFEEINSDYIHKYDALRPMVFELIHLALKTQPSAMLERHHINASQRIVSMFLELLERQFPLDDTHQCIQFRSASDFAKQLNVHVNHLNRAIKEITEKTTSQIIAERILQEAKILLKRSEWNVSDISYALGFKEITHFNNFFKKHVQLSPLKFRNV